MEKTVAKKTPAKKKTQQVKNDGVVAVKKIGRPSKYTDEIAAEICRRLSEGVPLREICRAPGMPDWSTVYYWMNANENLSQSIARAREIGADAIASESLEITDAPPERNQNGGIDAGYVAWAKLRAEHRLKLLAKWHPKKYGDKLDTTLSGPDGGPVQVAAVNLRGLSDADLATMQQILSRAGAG